MIVEFATHLFKAASKVHDMRRGGAVMKTRLLWIGSLAVFLMTVSLPAFAHHAWHGYDMANLTTVKGTVTQFDWGNPHVWINLEVTGDKGNIEKWAAGGPSPSRMAGTGWDKETLKPGDQITAVGHRIADGTYSLRLVKVVLADGRELICYGGR
jgi:Family of unknown function (DUF6152)